MTDFIQGLSRTQTTLFPDHLDDYVDDDNPVRVVDFFVDRLNLSQLGFETEPRDKGRPAYHPGMMLKLYIYGYLNRIHSSRCLEREAGRNVELMWLTGHLAPDFKTIADFRKDNGDAIRGVCRQFIQLCRRIGLLEDPVVAVDGSKFKAVNTRDCNFTKGKLKRRRDQIDESISRYLMELESADRKDTTASHFKSNRIKEKIKMLDREMRRLADLEKQIAASPDQQISLTDPDARSMATSGRGSGMVGYNVQTAVDTTHHLIVTHEVTQDGHDRRQLHNMALQAKTALGSEHLEVVADRGYFRGEEVHLCDQSNITTYLPQPLTSGSRKRGLFTKRDFIYQANKDEYRCPAGERLEMNYTAEEKGQTVHKYRTKKCPKCSIREQCTTAKYRRITRWEYEEATDALEERLDREPERMRVRRSTVEHPFGTLKCWMGYTHFTMRTLKHVRTEMSLNVLAYNLKRAMNILGTNQLMEAI